MQRFFVKLTILLVAVFGGLFVIFVDTVILADKGNSAQRDERQSPNEHDCLHWEWERVQRGVASVLRPFCRLTKKDLQWQDPPLIPPLQLRLHDTLTLTPLQRQFGDSALRVREGGILNRYRYTQFPYTLRVRAPFDFGKQPRTYTTLHPPQSFEEMRRQFRANVRDNIRQGN